MNDLSTRSIDVDDPRTWPQSVKDSAQRFADELRGTTEFTEELAIPIEGDREFRDLLSGYAMRAYHVTRLLEHENAMIFELGLRPLTPELLLDRVEAAFEHRCITVEERDQLQAGTFFAPGQDKGRADKVCLFLERYALDNAGMVDELMRTWGGEGISKASGSLPLQGKLEQMGRPAVVVVDVDLSASGPAQTMIPRLQKLFVGHLLELQNVVASVHYWAPVPPQQIVSILRPGDPGYDRFQDLRRK